MKLRQSKFKRITTATGLFGPLTVLLAPVLVARATLREWEGNAAMDNKWTTPQNWAGNVAPDPGDDLLFLSGARHPNNQNDFASGTAFNSIEFWGGGGPGYNISGNSIALNAGLRVENNSGVPIDHIVNNSLILNSNQTFTVINDVGILILAGPINLSGKDLAFNVSAGSEAQVQAVISGAGGLIKTNTGLLTLYSNNTYTGGTMLNGGTLQINGSQSASPVLLNLGTLKGKGTVGTITATGSGGPGTIVLSPGASPGILTCSNLALNASTTLSIELNGTTVGTGYDQLRVNGSMALGDATLAVTLGFTPVIGSAFTIVRNDGGNAVTGTFSGLPQGATFLAGSSQFQINYAGGDGNDVVLTRIVTLEIEQVSSNAVRLLWLTNGATGFSLQGNTNLATTNWATVSPPPTVLNTKNVVTNTITEAQKLYRLVKP